MVPVINPKIIVDFRKSDFSILHLVKERIDSRDKIYAIILNETQFNLMKSKNYFLKSFVPCKNPDQVSRGHLGEFIFKYTKIKVWGRRL